MINQNFTGQPSQCIGVLAVRPSNSRRYNIFVFFILAAVLAICLCQAGCTGLTSANATDPVAPPAQVKTSLTMGPGGSFGSVAVGSSATQNISIFNTGNAALDITQLAVTGAGYTVSGFTLPISVAAGQSMSVPVKFTPTATSAAFGSLSVTSNTTPAVSALAMSGIGVQGQLVATPSALIFTGVIVGTTSSQTVTLTNGGTGGVNVSLATPSGTGFNISGLSLPMQIGPGQSASFTASFTPTSGNTITGSIAILSNSSAPSLLVPFSATAILPQAQISVTPSSVSFGSVNVGASTPQALTVTNVGNATMNISNVTAAGAGYSVTGLSLPISVAAGQSASFTANFAPTITGSAPGSVTIISNAPSSPTVIGLTGAGVQGQLTANPLAAVFGNTPVGTTGSHAITLTNGGSASVTISQATPAGSGFAIAGLAIPLTLTAGQTSTFSATYTPTTTGAATGSITLTSNAPSPVTTISLSGDGTQPVIGATPSSVSFGNVTVGAPNSQTILLQNSGTASLTISQASVSGAGFSISGLTLPATIAAGSSTTFNVAYAPTSAGNATGSISLVNNSSNSTYAIPVSATGVAAILQLSASSSSLTFTNINVGSSSSQNVILTNNGNSNVTLSNFSISGQGFSATGAQAGLIIAAGQTATLSVTFTPASAPTVSGSVTVTSNATNSPLTISLSGTGVQAVSHSVTLSWDASTSSTVVGYNVYRSTVSGGPYTLLTSSPIAATTYTDMTVQAGVTYYYVVTAVDASGNESAYSNEASVTVPTS